MRRVYWRVLLYGLLAGWQLFQKAVYLFGPVEWLQPIIMRSQSLWLLSTDFLVDSLRALVPAFGQNSMMLLAHAIIDVGVFLLFVWLDRIFGVKHALLAIALSVPLFPIMPASDPLAADSALPLITSWAIWFVCLAVAAAVTLRAERSGRDLVFLVLLTIPLSILTLPVGRVEVATRLPIGLGIGAAVVVVYAGGLVRKRRASGRGGEGK
jgi:hypothetical protein